MSCLLNWVRYVLLNGRSLHLDDEPFVICDWEASGTQVLGMLKELTGVLAQGKHFPA